MLVLIKIFDSNNNVVYEHELDTKAKLSKFKKQIEKKYPKNKFKLEVK